MGHWAWGIGHWALGKDAMNRVSTIFICPCTLSEVEVCSLPLCLIRRAELHHQLAVRDRSGNSLHSKDRLICQN